MVDQPREQRNPCVVDRFHEGACSQSGRSRRLPVVPMGSWTSLHVGPCAQELRARASAPDEPGLVRLCRAVPPAGRDLPRRPLRGQPDRAPRADRRHARRAHPVRGRPHLRGRRGQARADPGARAQPVGRRGHERDVLLRRGDHRLGRRASRAGALEPGASRSTRALRSGNTGRPGSPDRGAVDRTRPTEGNAQHLPRRGARAVLARGVPPRNPLRRRSGARNRQRPHPRSARASGVDRRAHGPLQPSRVPRPAPAGGHARLRGARHGRARHVRSRRLQEGERRVRPWSRRSAARPGRGRAPSRCSGLRRGLPHRRRGVRDHPPGGRSAARVRARRAGRELRSPSWRWRPQGG